MPVTDYIFSDYFINNLITLVHIFMHLKKIVLEKWLHRASKINYRQYCSIAYAKQLAV